MKTINELVSSFELEELEQREEMVSANADMREPIYEEGFQVGPLKIW